MMRDGSGRELFEDPLFSLLEYSRAQVERSIQNLVAFVLQYNQMMIPAENGGLKSVVCREYREESISKLRSADVLSITE